MLACGETEAMVMAPPATCDSVSLCFHGCKALLHIHFPVQSLPSHPLDQSLHSQEQPSSRGCSTIPKLHLPVTAFQGTGVPVRGMNVCMCPARTVWFSFYLGCHRSAVSLSTLNVFPLTHTIAPKWVSDPSGWGSVPPPTRAGLVLLTLLFFPLVPSFYQVFCNSIYSFPLVRTSCPLSDGVLHALLCLKVYPSCIREEMYCTSTYSSTLLFFHLVFLFDQHRFEIFLFSLYQMK